jgi:hypothetical protein
VKHQLKPSRLFKKGQKEFLLAMYKTKMGNLFLANYRNSKFTISTIDYLFGIVNKITGGLFSSEKYVLDS